LNEKRGHVPKHNFEVIITMKCDEFHKLCKNMYNMSCKFIEITCNKNVARFSSIGDGLKVCKEYSKSETTEDGGINIKTDKKSKDLISVKNVYDIKHFMLFGKTKQICTEVRIYLKNKFPAILSYKIAALGTMIVGVSPVVEETLHNGDSDEEGDDNTLLYKRTEIEKIDDDD
jgi:hypothetical protein